MTLRRMFCQLLLLSLGVSPGIGAPGEPGPGVRLQVSAPAPGTLLVEATADAQEEQSVDGARRAVGIAASGFPVLERPGLPRLPFVCLTLMRVGTLPSAQLVQLATDTVAITLDSGTEPIEVSFSEEGTHVEEQMAPPTGLYPPEPLELLPVGSLRGRELIALRLFPFRCDAQGKLIIHRKMVARLTGVEAMGPSRFLPGGAKLPQQLARPLQAASGSTVPHPGLRLVVKEDGIYRVTAAQMAKAGIDPATIDPRNFRLTRRGRQVAVYVFGERDGRFDPTDYVEFWGESNRQTFQAVAPDMYLDPFSDENTYWLSWEGPPGMRMTEEQAVSHTTDPWAVTVPRSYWYTVHVERDDSYNRLSQLPADSLRDHWFFDSGLQAGTLREYRFHLPWPDQEAADQAELRALLHGLSSVPGVAHNVSLFLNGFRAAEAQWIGQERMAVGSAPGAGVPPERLQHGDNVLTLINNLAPEVVDLVALNWFELSYARRYRAEEDMIEFALPKDAPPGVYEFRVDGFTVPNVEIYKLGVSKIIGAAVERVQDEQEGWSYQVRFQDQVFSSGTRYVAVAGRAKKPPLRLEPAEPTWLRSVANGADYVAIAPDSLALDPALQQLIAHRQSQGLRTMIVPLQAVYDEFNYGIPSPYALKEFLSYAWHYWQPPALSYVLLVGDGSWDYKDRPRRGGNLLPVFLRQTIKWGAAASDHWYALVDGGDEVPDLFVGRLPVRHSQELAALVDKILSYERTSPMDAWRNRLLLIGGNGSVFRQQSETLLAEVIPPFFAVERLYTGASAANDPFAGGTAQLIEHLAQGVAYANFLGHGGGAVWSDNSLFRLEDVALLPRNGRYPIVSSMTCFTGAFEEPTRRSLGEELLVAPGAGAVAFFGSAGLGWLYNDYYLVREFIDALVQADEATTLGEVVAQAKVRYLSAYPGYLNYSMVSQYNLLGDPALRTVLPRRTCSLQLATRVARGGDSLRVQGAWQSSGVAVLNLVDARRKTVDTRLSFVRNGTFGCNFVVPSAFTGAGHVRAFLYDEAQRQTAHGAISFAVAEVYIDSVWTAPHRPRATDSVLVCARVFASGELASVTCLLESPRADTIGMILLAPGGSEYVAQRQIPPFARGTLVRLSVVARDQAQNEQRCPYSYTVCWGPELFVDPSATRLGGSGTTQLEATIWNSGDVECKGVLVEAFLLDSPSGQWRHIGSTVVDVAPQQKALAAIPGFFGNGAVHVRVLVDADQRFEEANELNNAVDLTLQADRFTISPQLGSTVWGTATDTLCFGADLALVVAPGSSSVSTVVQGRRIDSLQVFDQPDLRPLRIAGKAVAYELLTMTDGATIPAAAGIRFAADSLSPSAAVFAYRGLTRKWERMPPSRKGNWLWALVSLPARLALMESNDVLPPTIETLVDGQAHVHGAYAAQQPLITFLVQDANGVALSSHSLRIVLDGQPLASSSLLLPDSVPNGNYVPISFRPQLGPGTHTCQVQVCDCSGNIAGPVDIVLTVAAAFRLRVLGTYPNPFARRTVFVYELTRWANDLSLSIYTTSGHLLRRFTVADASEAQNPLAPGYHEIPWDGTDEHGEQVANGVYFYKLRCVDGEEVLEQTGTIARVR
ncbi:MAG: C25 family cysteine peptidase [candidate division KSB1 bacterium]|jgi:hypothetical protein|nr:C25 family cysteine peptidase [candidate division KSB1 bacterium]